MSLSETPETVEVDFIAPRHLAGGGDPAWITVPLHRAGGWSYGHDPLLPRVLLASPDQQALLRLEPAADGQWWTLRHTATPQRPAWYASFGARTPVELIAAFTDALTDPAASPATLAPYEPLERARWTPTPAADGLRSPDGTALVEQTDSEGAGPWCVTVALASSRPVWQARFGKNTPPHLITEFTTALADPRPLPRPGGPLSIPARLSHLITRTTRQVPAVQVAGALEERVHALAARRAACRAALPPRGGRPRGAPDRRR
ncbi:DUF317 domain-containing protein [Streptomyces sp. NPDC057654]|uniref:DUF317 domain-containing protein n=1 Tax=Streptomyces sp. NPDC057654 TaxID=3346196 RepID=UPI00368C4CD9